MTAVIDPRATDRLAKLCGMLGSDHAGERAAAAAKADDMVRSLGLRWADVISVPLAPADPTSTDSVAWQDALEVCLDHVHELDPRSQAFVRALSRWPGAPSEKQLVWLFDLYSRIDGKRR